MTTHFESTVNQLLCGQIICEVGQHEALFIKLSEESFFDEVNAFLHRIGKKVVSTEDDRAFYCAFLTLEPKENMNVVKKQFQHTFKYFEGLIAWLRLVRGITNNARPVVAGDVLNESELLQAIETSSNFNTQLINVFQRFKKDATNKETKAQLSTIMKILVEEDYLVKIGETGSVYRATGKFSLLYEQLDFIQRYQGIPLVDSTQQQGSLAL